MGASPHWDADTQSLYYADQFGSDSDLIRYDWNEKRIYRASVPLDFSPRAVGFIIPLEGAKDLFFTGDGSRIVKLIRWDGRTPTVEVIQDVFAIEQDLEFGGNILHISKACPVGRFYGGSMKICK